MEYIQRVVTVCAEEITCVSVGTMLQLGMVPNGITRSGDKTIM